MCLYSPLALLLADGQNGVYSLFNLFVYVACEASSIANLAVISVDRLYSVSNPFKHHTNVTPSIAHRIMFGVWGYAIAVALVQLLEEKWKNIVIFFFGFFLPLCVMIVCYFKIIVVVR